MSESHKKRVWFSLRNFALAAAPLVTAVLLVACLLSPGSSVLCYIALAPIGLAMTARQLPRSAYASAYLAGLLVHLAGMAWVLNCYRYESTWGPYAIQWYWIGVWGGALLAGAFALGRLLSWRCRLPMTLLLPMLWVVLEFVRHEMAEVVTGTAFPWLKLGTTIADNQHLVQIADLGGEYLLTFLVAMVNGAVVDAMRIFYVEDRKRRLMLAYAGTMALALLAMALGYGHWRLGQSTGKQGPTVCLLGEVDLPPLLSRKRLTVVSDHQRPSDSSGQQGRMADLLLWPELAYHHRIVEVDPLTTKTSSPTTGLGPQTQEKQSTLARRASEENRIYCQSLLTKASLAHRASVVFVAGPDSMEVNRMGADKHFATHYLEQTSRNLGATLVIGCERQQITGERVQHFNSLACVDPVMGFQGCYDKINLVPGAEAPISDPGTEDGVKDGYSRGKTPRVFCLPTESGTYHFGAAICYDICFGQHFRQSRADNVDFFVQCGSEGQDTSGRVAQWMLRYSRLRAVENRRSVVRNANFGYSALIDGNGRVLSSLPPVPITEPAWLGSVPIDRRWSFYVHWGDWIAYLACVMVFIWGIVDRRPSAAC